MKIPQASFAAKRSKLKQKYSKKGDQSSKLLADYLISFQSGRMFIGEISNNSARMNSIAQKLYSSALKKFRFLTKNAFLTLNVFIQLSIGIFHKHRHSSSYVLLYSLVESQIRSTTEVEQFLNESRLELGLGRETRVILESKTRTTSTSNQTIATTDPLLKMVLENTSRLEKIKIITDLTWRIIKNLLLLDYLGLFFFKQLSVDKFFVTIMNKNNVEYIMITTQTHLQRLPAAFYFQEANDKRRIMIWYSDNSWIIEKRNDSKIFDRTRYLRDEIDIHLCWSTSWREYLIDVGVTSEIKSVGSLLFYPSRIEKKVSAAEFDLVIFDVHPSPREYEYEFYSSKEMDSFWQCNLQVIERILANDCKLRVAVKQKRKINQGLLSTFKPQLEIVDVNENLYEVIANARMVIGVPFVSPIFIAREMSVRAAYFYCNEFEKWLLPKKHEEIEILGNQKELEDWITMGLNVEWKQ
jgi:polysaccharide biosynthesis PFTS motif protein